MEQLEQGEERMDPEIAALATSAGGTVVTLMATEAWQRTRDGLVALWRRAEPERAEAVGGELDIARDDLARARQGGDLRSEHEVLAQWQDRLRHLLAAQPAIAEELRLLLESVTAAPGTAASPVVRLRAEASGHGRVYQAGRDQHITEK
ncbi:hypothetical protein GCM10009665_24090 [Kitasatospora nipponensis]|uniref:Uncharacterized protein n=1 Tax=Kitasatospora nipponensis TaxID=258049 RepID=A0ABP4GQK8_9ACTN